MKDPGVLEEGVRAKPGRGVKVVAILLPMSGSAGIWGPSCISCAQLAIDEVNRADGIAGNILQPIFLDADAGRVVDLGKEIATLLDDNVIDAIVGMTVSSVRQSLIQILNGCIPFIYTPLYEGNENSPNVYTIGETPADQLEPAIGHLSRALHARRWALIGNDYVWPRASHAVARRSIGRNHGEVVYERYVPFGLEEPDLLVEQIARQKPDIVIVSLIGQDAVDFNRAFGNSGLDRRIVRFSTAIDENVLLATGERNTRRLLVASSYFASLATDQNLAFKARYEALHATRPPVLNALGQSIYEGIHFYAALAARRDDDASRSPVQYRSARAGNYQSNSMKTLPVYLAQADGHEFSVQCELN